MDHTDLKSITIAIFVWKMCNGGIERLVSLLIPVLNGIGFRTVLLTNEAPTPQDYPIAGENPRRYVLPLDGEARQSELDRIFETEHIDVFFAHSYDCKSLDDDFKTAGKRGIRTLLTWHSSFTATVLQECDRYFEQYQVAISADMVLTQSRTDEYFFQSCGVFAKYVPNISTFKINCDSPRTSAKAPPVILFPARITPQKNPQDAILIFAEVHKVIPNAVLKMIGSDKHPDLEQAIDDLIRQNGLQKSVQRLAFRPDIENEFQEADIMLMPSGWEGWGLTLLEAKAHALPIAAYDLPYVETMNPNTGVLTAELGDMQAMARNIIELLQNPQLYRKTSEDGLNDAKEKAAFDFQQAYREVFAEQFQPQQAENKPPYGAVMLKAMSQCIDITRKTFYRHGYKAGRELVCSGLTYKIGRLFMWLPVKIKNLLHRG